MTELENLSLDCKVTIPGGGQGHLRYIGPIEGKNGTFGGVELIGPAIIRGKNSGDVDGIQYFETRTPGTGLFVPLAKLQLSNRPPSRQSRMVNNEMETPTPVNRGQRRVSSMESNSSSSSLVGSRRISGISRPPALVNGRPVNGTTVRSPSSMGRSNSSLGQQKIVSPPTITKRVTNGVSTDPRLMRLERELKELTSEKAQIEADKNTLDLMLQEKEYAMKENLKILNDLQKTVVDLQPILENYENELNDKDAKLQNQKSEFETAREEWRQTMDIMLADGQTSEEFYNQSINDLKRTIATNEFAIKELQERLREFDANAVPISSESAVMTLNKDIIDNSNEETADDEDLRKVIAKQDLAKIENDKIILEFKTEIIELQSSLSSTEAELKEKQKMIETLTSKINKIKSEYEDIILKKDLKIEDLELLLKEGQSSKDINTDANISDDDLNSLKEENAKLKTQMGHMKDDFALEKEFIFEAKDKRIASLEESLRDLSKNPASSASETDSEDVTNLKKSLSSLQQEKERTITEHLSLLQDRDEELQILTEKLKLSSNKNLEVDELQHELESLKLGGDKNEKDMEIAKLKEELVELKKSTPEKEELVTQLKALSKELDGRPTINEIVQLEDELELLDEIRKEDIRKSKLEITILKDQLKRLEGSLESATSENRQYKSMVMDGKLSDITNKSFSEVKPRDLSSSIGNMDYKSSQVIDGELLIYKPDEKIDPSAGRAKWCGLCERDGHDSVDCPYENDVF